MSDYKVLFYDDPCHSDCCQAPVLLDVDICSDCKEHCLIICKDDDTGEDFIYNDGDEK